MNWHAPAPSANSPLRSGACVSSTIASATRETIPDLSERQVLVLRAIVASYVGEAAPVGSRSVSHVLPVSLSAASIRTTMAELAERGLVEKPHPSAGRIPTASGLRCFLEHLVPRELDEYERRDLAGSVAGVGPDAVIQNTSRR